MKQNYITYLFLIFIANSVFCQKSNEKNHQINIGIPEVALISVHNGNSLINLQGSNVTKAGKKVIFNVEDSSTWINYSSIIGSIGESSRFVTLEISEGKVPDGLELLVKASKDVGEGNGQLGKPANSRQILDQNPIKIIENIGSCYTGVGTNKGHNISYLLKLSGEENSYSKLDFDQSQTIAITYTLSDN